MKLKKRNNIFPSCVYNVQYYWKIMIWGWEGSYKRKGEILVRITILGASTFKEPLSMVQGSLRNQSKYFFGVCVVVQDVDRTRLWSSTPSTRMGGAGGQ